MISYVPDSVQSILPAESHLTPRAVLSDGCFYLPLGIPGLSDPTAFPHS